MASKAATKVADAVVESVVRKAPFRVGQKKVYLPNHVVSFLRPKEGQSATTATFEVPLTFNKLDFRDYLYHLYDVEVRSVRSFINQRLPKQRSIDGKTGKWYRPRSQKLMIVDLVKPFVWPERPSQEAMTEWDHKLFESVESGHDQEIAEAERRARGTPILRPHFKQSLDRTKLAATAKELLEGKKKWNPGMEWLEVEKDGEGAEVAKTVGASEPKEVSG